LAIHNNKFILDSARVSSEMINRKQQTQYYWPLLYLKKTHVSHHILFITACAQSANASGKRWHHSQPAGSTTCISQSSVATVLKWNGQKYSHLRRVDVARQKLLKSANDARSYSENKSGTCLWTTVYKHWIDSLTVACRTSDREGAGSTPGQGSARQQASCSLARASVHRTVQF